MDQRELILEQPSSDLFIHKTELKQTKHLFVLLLENILNIYRNKWI